MFDFFCYYLFNFIEDAMRLDTAASSFWGSAFCALFRRVSFASLCLAIFWLILFHLVRSCQVRAWFLAFAFRVWEILRFGEVRF